MDNFILTSKEDFYHRVCFLINTLKEYDLTQTQIGILLDVTDRTIRNWEKGSTLPNGVQYFNLCKLCKNVESRI